ncbi:MAG: hypothetical protein M5U01_04360 [Ardenticatenaceae bacterium]|nr:hypothetical protein [Ardenticatenaceae bacterium]
MAEPSAERRRLLQQAVHGFAQRHPDYAVAGIERQIADVVGRGVASVQKWRAGHHVPEWHVPALAEWAVYQAGMDRRWLRAFLRQCDYRDLALETRLFGPEAVPSEAAWWTACHAVNTLLWGSERLTTASTLYQPREALLAVIEAFLASDRSGLILVGASGLGKTSLALWLAGWAEAPRAVVVYPAARLDGTPTLADLLRESLASSLPAPESDVAPAPLTWPILAIFDGVNESLEMVHLAWQLDRGLVEARGLKVLLTFRPESFQVARHSITLAGHCYFAEPPPGAPTAGVAFDPPAVHLLPFTPDELPAAYDLYRQAYGLKTPYTELSAALREAMCHPLTLRLLAETWAGGHLPEEVDPDALVQQLLDVLVETGRLQRADVRFVEDDLMALMIAPGQWGNALTSDQMAGARAADGRHLVTPGEPGPLTRLADAGILATTNGRLDEPLRFAHERFYEHFAGRRLRSLRATAPDPRAFYADLVAAPAFLYSPARRLLAEEIARQPLAWLADLCQRAPISRFGILMGALEEWRREHPDQARAGLEYLWGLSRPRLARWLNAAGLPAPTRRRPPGSSSGSRCSRPERWGITTCCCGHCSRGARRCSRWWWMRCSTGRAPTPRLPVTCSSNWGAA